MAKFDAWKTGTLFDSLDVDVEIRERGLGRARKERSATSREAGLPRSVATLMSAIDSPPPEPDLFREQRAERSGLPRYRFNFPGGIIR